MNTALGRIAEWMPRQRWYGSKGREPELGVVGTCDLGSPDDAERARILFLLDRAGTTPVLYQVPVVERSADAADALLAAEPEASARLIGAADGTVLFDGPSDPAFTDALLRMMATGSTARCPANEGAALATGRYTGGDPSAVLAALERGPVPARVLSGEQSNTSIIYRPDGAAPIICKVFRQLHEGENPDVELQTELARAGSPHVPASVGDVVGEWPDPGQPSGRARGHLAFAQEFLPGVEDAFRVARAACAAGRSFVDEARALGAAVAEVHVALGERFPRERATSALLAEIEQAWNRRLRIALDEAPVLSAHRAGIEGFYRRALDGPWPELQRVHGDLHLGQVILVPGQGWKLLDFEGEPMRPMLERRRADLPVRDVAGMLRSFDYAAGTSVLLEGADPAAAQAWADAARQAFLDGYVGATGLDLQRYRDLLAAFELDKAVYETIYETRNRPDWIGIPLRAISVLLGEGPMRASLGVVAPGALAPEHGQPTRPTPAIEH